uniref:Cathepsin propeptide inhibitor domain-containing protein n=1 Tax=Anopheles atroparvus TaxID=41427 RepID=A0A182JIN0_ANOAO
MVCSKGGFPSPRESFPCFQLLSRTKAHANIAPPGHPVFGGLAPIDLVATQPKKQPIGDVYSAIGSGLSGSMSPRTNPNSPAYPAAPDPTRSDLPILQSAGKRSPEDWKLISLSEELDPLVAGVGTQELVAAVGKPGSKEQPVAPLANVTNAPVTKGDSFRSYMETHRKKYYAQYRAQRRQSAYIDNLEEIAEHNKEFKAGKNRFQLAPNAFADMQNSEYRKRLIRLKMDPHRKVSPTISDEIVSSVDELPESLDWREKGFQTAQANQKSCGSCYAFSVAYAVSAQLLKHIGRVELVSEQQMVDCSTATGNLGCGGGSLRNTLKYLKQAGGVMRASDYPYTSSKIVVVINSPIVALVRSSWKEHWLTLLSHRNGPSAPSLHQPDNATTEQTNQLVTEGRSSSPNSCNIITIVCDQHPSSDPRGRTEQKKSTSMQ